MLMPCSPTLSGGVAEKVIKAGLRCIVSNQDKLYLDHLDAFWQDFYSNEPLTNITDHKQQALILGVRYARGSSMSMLLISRKRYGQELQQLLAVS
ncbi:hypothetical protein ACS0TY_001745 [Phlomoides rotata]